MGGVQSRPDGGGVRRMFYGALSADGWQSSTYGRLLLPPEATLKLSLNSVLERLVMSSTPRLRTSTSLVVDAATFVNSVNIFWFVANLCQDAVFEQHIFSQAFVCFIKRASQVCLQSCLELILVQYF